VFVMIKRWAQVRFSFKEERCLEADVSWFGMSLHLVKAAFTLKLILVSPSGIP